MWDGSFELGYPPDLIAKEEVDSDTACSKGHVLQEDQTGPSPGGTICPEALGHVRGGTFSVGSSLAPLTLRRE